MSGGLSTEQFAGENGEKNPRRWIPREKCIEIIDDLQAVGVQAVQFTGGGEPTVHPDHLDIFDHALHQGLSCALVTNGSLLREGWQAILPSFKWVRVSVDAGTPLTYSEVRNVRPGAFEKTLNNISLIRAEIDRQGTDCLLGAGFVVTALNWDEIVTACQLLKNAGASYVRLGAMFSEEGSGYYSGIYDNIKIKIWQAKELEDDSFKVVDLFGDRITDLDVGAPGYKFCGYQQFVMYIGGDQKVYRCCTTSYTKHGEIGDLSEQSFSQWFGSRAKQDAIANFNARSCKVCQFNGKNETINYMVEPEPLHGEFV